MNEAKMIYSTEGRKPHPRPGKDCLDEYRLAIAHPVSLLTEPERDHVSDCPYCTERLADLARLQSLEAPERLGSDLLQKAVNMGEERNTRRIVPRWAAAAVLVLAAGLVIFQMSPWQEPGPDLSAPAEYSPVRNVDRGAFRPEVLLPKQGDLTLSEATRIEWTDTPGSLYYDVRLVMPDGDPVHQARVITNHWELPPDLQLAVGQEYFVRVDAYLAGGRRVSSKHVSFTPVQAN